MKHDILNIVDAVDKTEETKMNIDNWTVKQPWKFLKKEFQKVFK